MIESSFAQQYGIRLRKEKDMTWDEFCTYLTGLNSETPLGRIVSIRAETDHERIKNFNSHERKIYDDWQKKRIRKITEEEGERNIKMFESMLKNMAKT